MLKFSSIKKLNAAKKVFDFYNAYQVPILNLSIGLFYGLTLGHCYFYDPTIQTNNNKAQSQDESAVQRIYDGSFGFVRRERRSEFNGVRSPLFAHECPTEYVVQRAIETGRHDSRRVQEFLQIEVWNGDFDARRLRNGRANPVD